MKRELTTAILAGFGMMTLSCGRVSQAGSVDTRVIPAHTETVQLRKVSDYFQAPGTVRARTTTVLSSRIAGPVLSVSVREGDRVRTGQSLIEIDSREASIQLKRAQAGADEARRGREEAERSINAADAALRAADANRDLALSTQKRYGVLRDRNSVSAQEYDEIETRYKGAALEVERSREALSAAKARRDQVLARIQQAEAEIESAQVALGYSRIVAPIDGIVTARHIEPGMLAAPGTPFLTIDDDRAYQLEVTLEETRVSTIAIGQHARVEISALPAPVDGRVVEIVPAADPATRTYTVKLDLGAALRTNSVRSGFFGRALFNDGDRLALIVPDSAVIHRGQLDGVFIVDRDVCLLRLVKLGKHYSDGIEILSGLEAGARIVSTPNSDIADGVRIEEAAGGKTP